MTTSAAVAPFPTAAATPVLNRVELKAATVPSTLMVSGGTSIVAASAGGSGGGGGLEGSGGGFGGGGGGGGIVQSSADVLASLPNVLRPTGHSVGRSLAVRGQYVSAGQGRHVVSLTAAVKLL
jgi:hypothetical protein